jgi:integrase
MPLTERLTAILKARKVNSAGDSIFGYRSINKTFRRAVPRAGSQDVRLHGVRHTVGTRLIQAGLNGAKVKEVLGHQTVKMTMRYTHLDGEE